MTWAVQILSGTVLPLLLMAAGGCFAVWLLPLLVRGRRGKHRTRQRGSFKALSVALAGTLGVGNIAGVASAIAMGGAGAVFWMWISALFAMLLKYAEVVLAMRTRRYDGKGRAHGGAPYYIRVAFGGRLGRLLASLFALLCVACSFTLGGVVQSAAAAEVLEGAFSLPPILVGTVLGGLAALILATGARSVERACTAIVPAVCLLFTVASLAAILLRVEAVPRAMSAIFRDAFRARSAMGGVLGFLNTAALRYGVARGIVSNEAGCGTAPIAHAAATGTSPARQGRLGILEVLVDTVLLCTVTALVILTSGVPVQEGGGMRYALAAYSATLGSLAEPILALSVLLFAFATVLCWAHYGAESLRYLTKKRALARMLPLVTAASCILGAVAAPDLVWDLTDLILALMAILNISALLALRRDVMEESVDCGGAFDKSTPAKPLKDGEGQITASLLSTDRSFDKILR